MADRGPTDGVSERRRDDAAVRTWGFPDAARRDRTNRADGRRRRLSAESTRRRCIGTSKASAMPSPAAPTCFVTTKLGNSDHGFNETLRAFDASLRRLGRDKLDLYLIHWPRPRAGLYVESWKALIRLQKEGRVRSIGVSNFTREHLERIIAETGVAPTVNQIELHPRSSRRLCALSTTISGSEQSCGVPARAGRVARRGRNRRHRVEAQENPGASRHPVASRQRSDRHSETVRLGTPEGEYRRARFPARRG